MKRSVWMALICASALACSEDPSPAKGPSTETPPAATGGGGAGVVQPPVSGGCAFGQVDCGGQCVNTLTNPAHCGGCNIACAAGSLCVQGVCTVQCAAGQALCGGLCTTVASDPLNCGTCGVACPAGQYCDSGVCSVSCSGVLCPVAQGMLCIDPQTNPEHCGACGVACPAGTSCVAGQCTLVCPAPLVACQGQCVDVQSDPLNCGSCGVPCPAGTPCVAGACGCSGGLVLCGGQCVDLLSDAANCGACGVSCAAGVCTQGQCQCQPGQTTCNGVCVDTQADSANCGNCGVVCPTGQVCAAGVCTVAGCPAGTVQCGADCVDTTSNASHCGACNVPCDVGRVCVASTCQCPAPTVDCGGACVDVSSNPSHCGGCNQVCPGGASCSGGVCVCPTGTAECNGACLDLSADPSNCGQCGLVCPAEQNCVAGSCVCPDGGIYCGDAGCVDLQSSNENCGQCGVTCSGGRYCASGSCQCEAPLLDCGGTCVDVQTSNEHCGACNAPCPEDRSCVDGACSGIVGDGPDDCGGDAHSVTIEKISVYQAVEVPLMEGGNAIGAESRNADVVQGRDATFRVHLRLESGWVAREVSARVILNTNGTEQIVYAKMTPTQDSTQGDLASTARVEVDADLIGPDTRYAVQIAECTAGTSGTTALPRFPAEGDIELAARATGPLDIVFVPVTVDSWVPDTSDVTIQLYREYMAAMYPTTEVRTSVTSEFTTYSGFDWAVLLDQLRNRRSQEGLAEEVYFFGLVRPAETLMDYCRGGCTAGIGYVTDLGGWSSGTRVACGLAYGDETSAETMAHEIGHNHGRDHTPCNVSGDPNYPYAGGSIGSWGYDRRSGSLKDPARFADILGYCSPVWVSDWTFQAFADRIAALNGAASREVVPEGAAVAWRVLQIDGAGARWGIPYSKPAPPSGRAMAAEVLAIDGEVLATTVVHATPYSTGGVSYLVPPPQSDWHAIQIQGQPAVAYP